MKRKSKKSPHGPTAAVSRRRVGWILNDAPARGDDDAAVRRFARGLIDSGDLGGEGDESALIVVWDEVTKVGRIYRVAADVTLEVESP